ncbi:MAG: flagellar protein FlgN [Oscillospiraceae bacterium]|nr:flagellar protein FlgN [Oscillospiraceae bacterium]
MLDFAKITVFFDEYTAHYKDFLDFEYKKADMITKNEIEELSKALSTEQALIMKTNSYEGRRAKLLGGDSELTFERLVEKAPEHYKNKLEASHKEMSEMIFKIKEINDRIGVIVAARLKQIQKRTAELDTYDDKGVLNRKSATRAINYNA